MGWRGRTFITAAWLGLTLAALPARAQSPAPGVELRQWQGRWTPLEQDVLQDAWDAPGWEPMTLPGRMAPRDDVLWLRTRLPAGDWKQPAIRVDAIIANAQVYLDRTLILADPVEGLTGPSAHGIPWQLLDLPPDFAGRTLTLRMRILYRPGGVRGIPVLGEREQHLAWAMAHGLPRLVVGLMMVVMALLSLLLISRRGNWRIPLGFAAACLGQGGFMVYHTFIKDVLWPAPVAWFILWIVVVPLETVGHLLFLDQVFGSGPKGALARLFRLHLGYSALLLLLVVPACLVVDYHGSPAVQPIGSMVFATLSLGMRATILVSLIIIVWLLVRHARAGNRDAQLYLLGMVPQALVLVDAVVAAFGMERSGWTAQAHWGSLAQAVSLALILQRRDRALTAQLADQAAQLRARNREKERLLADLHDGVGSMATNIRMLAELGRKNEARARQSLDTIEDLSGRALSELRAFVLTLDETNADWPGLAAELRRFGAQLVEGQGRVLEMDTTLDVPGTPGGLLSVGLLRIYKEAITNALKHGTGVVRVRLDVTPQHGTLTVANAVSPQTAPGINARRGLGNMKSRAVDLGGALDFQLAQGEARVVFTFPIPHKPPTAPPPQPALGQ